MIERQVTVAEGIDLAIGEAGAGGHPLLFVHGFGGAKEDFTGWLDRCAERGWHAVACDNRGTANSSRPVGEDQYSFDIVASDVLALADALGWSRFTLFGLSMGGMVAQVVALKAPERLDALILMSTSHTRPDRVDPETVKTGQEIVRQGGTALLVEIQRSAGPDPVSTPAYQRLIAEDPAYEEFGRNKSLATGTDAWVGLVEDVAHQPDRLDALRSLTVPTYVIAGEEDEGFIHQCRAIAEAVPGVRFVVIPDAGHSPQFEAPEAWWSVFSSFLDEVHS